MSTKITNGFGGRCHRMRVPRARWSNDNRDTSTPTRPLSSAYRNLMNFGHDKALR